MFTVAVQCQENDPNILTHGGMDFVSLAAVVGDHCAGGVVAHIIVI